MIPTQGFPKKDLWISGIAVLVVLALIIPHLARALKSARTVAAPHQQEIVIYALKLFETNCGFFPPADDGLRLLIKPGFSENHCKHPQPDPYLANEDLLNDLWGNPYIYKNSVATKEVRLISLGADGKEGGEGQDADLVTENLNEDPSN